MRAELRRAELGEAKRALLQARNAGDWASVRAQLADWNFSEGSAIAEVREELRQWERREAKEHSINTVRPL